MATSPKDRQGLLLVLLALAVALLLWFGSALVRVENERYARQVGMCKTHEVMPDYACLKKVQTRTGWWWHLLYALTD